MKNIVFLTKDHILSLHKKAILDYGGLDSIRDISLLDSAIAQPEATFDGVYLNDSIFLMAATYFFHISQNQPFFDGNNRTGFLAMFVFLKVNGYNLSASNEEIFPILYEVANGILDKADLANFIKQYSIKTD